MELNEGSSDLVGLGRMPAGGVRSPSGPRYKLVGLSVLYCEHFGGRSPSGFPGSATHNYQCYGMQKYHPHTLEVWPESHWPGFALHQTDVL